MNHDRWHRVFLLVVLMAAGMMMLSAAPVPQRASADRPDDVSGHQIHVMYVLPSDGADQQLDTNGTIRTSVAAFQKWLAGQTRGQRLRLDTYKGTLDITFFRLSQSDAQIRGFGDFERDHIEAELNTAGFNQPNKIYAVYYDGGHTKCGDGAWPPTLPGNVAALYLRGTPPSAPACSTNRLAASEDTPGYLEFSMLHEILHTMGFVALCAPNQTEGGHVADDRRDLMYRGRLPWQPSILDVGRDDYFEHHNSGCLDLAKSLFLDTVWVDFNYAGATKLGNFDMAYNTLAQGRDAVPDGGMLKIKAGSTKGAITINKRMRIEASGGTVTIGR